MSVQKPFAFIKDTDEIVHASASREGVEYEWHGGPVHPVSSKWFAYNPRSTARRACVERFTDPSESTAHVATKWLIKNGISINCEADGCRLLLRLRDVALESPANNRIPDVTGYVEYCWPYWNEHGRKMHIEVHFANKVSDRTRKLDLQALGPPVLEIHLQTRYIRKVEDAIEDHRHYLELLRALLTYGWMGGTWIKKPSTALRPPTQSAFDC